MSNSEPNADMQFSSNMPQAPVPDASASSVPSSSVPLSSASASSMSVSPAPVSSAPVTPAPKQSTTVQSVPTQPAAMPTTPVPTASASFTVISNENDSLSALQSPEEHTFSTNSATNFSSVAFGELQEDTSDEDSLRVQRGLTRLDPLTKRPRISSIVLCLVFALIFAGAAFGVYWLGVQTMLGQSFDDIVFVSLTAAYSGNEFLHAVAIPFGHTIMVIISAVIAALAFLIASLRKRWWLLAQMVLLAAIAYACTFLKHILPRPYLINTVAGDNNHTNSAPSGHTILMMLACVLLFMAVSRAWRGLVAVFGALLTFATQVMLIMLGWHRASDVMMSVLLVTAASMIVLAFTRVSGMDAAGKRRSSASVQMVATVFICAGLCALAYASYAIWQLLPGLDISASWTVQPSTVSALVAMGGLSVFAWGMLLMMRHLTASPLSKIGLVGAPPAPPRR